MSDETIDGLEPRRSAATEVSADAAAAPPAFHLLAKPTGSICNLDCAYCFFLEKQQLYPGTNARMDDALLETYIRQLIDAHQTSEVTIAGKAASLC